MSQYTPKQLVNQLMNLIFCLIEETETWTQSLSKGEWQRILNPSNVEMKSHHILSTKKKERKNKIEQKRSSLVSTKKLAYWKNREGTSWRYCRFCEVEELQKF